jgi:hypothetical protein
VRRALAEAGEIIDPEVLMEEGVQFLQHEYKHTDARRHEGLLGWFFQGEAESFSRVLVYQLVFPANLVPASEPANRFLAPLMQTRAVRALENRILALIPIFIAFSAEERRDALEAWMDRKNTTAATKKFVGGLTMLKNDFYYMDVLKRTAYVAREELRSQGL